jgi:hypothetical protein
MGHSVFVTHDPSVRCADLRGFRAGEEGQFG